MGHSSNTPLPGKRSSCMEIRAPVASRDLVLDGQLGLRAMIELNDIKPKKSSSSILA